MIFLDFLLLFIELRAFYIQLFYTFMFPCMNFTFNASSRTLLLCFHLLTFRFYLWGLPGISKGWQDVLKGALWEVDSHKAIFYWGVWWLMVRQKGNKGVNMVRYMQRNGNCKRFTLGMPRHFYQDQLDILGANVNDVEKAVGHMIDTVAEKSYKVNQQYLKRLLPYIEELGHLLDDSGMAG